MAETNMARKAGLRFTFWLALCLGQPLLPVYAQINSAHYLVGTEGILAGSLPPPGVYFDDLNWYGTSSTIVSLVNFPNVGQNYQVTTYVNQPRLRWMTPFRLLGADYGMEIMVPWIRQQRQLVPTLSFVSIPFYLPGYQVDQSEFEDVEISPLLLAWHLKQFDITAGYAFWVPTGNNQFDNVRHSVIDPYLSVPPPQFHWWENMITFGGTWYPDTRHQWAVSALTHYEISQAFDSTAGATEYGQVFIAEWGLSRAAGKYWELGFVGNYSEQITATRNNFGGTDYTVYSGAPLQIGPEIKVTVPHCGFSASFRYLHEMLHDGGNDGQYYPDVLALTLTQRF